LREKSRTADAYTRNDSRQDTEKSFQSQEVCSNKELFFSLFPVLVTSSSHPSIASTSLLTPGTSCGFCQSHSFYWIPNFFA